MDGQMDGWIDGWTDGHRPHKKRLYPLHYNFLFLNNLFEITSLGVQALRGAHIHSIGIIQCQHNVSLFKKAFCYSAVFGEGCWVNQGHIADLLSTAAILMAMLSNWLKMLYKSDEIT